MSDSTVLGGGSGRAVLAWTLWAVAVVMMLTGVTLSVAARALHYDSGTDLLPALLATIGALTAARVPRNPIGWLLLGVGVVGGVGTLANGYANLALLAGSGSARLGEVSAWVTMWLFWPFVIVPLTFVLLLFPDGRLPSSRWRIFPWLSAVAIAVTAAYIALQPGAGEGSRWTVENRFALDGDSPVLAALGIGVILNVPALFGAGAAVVVRFRRARGIQRQQFKWVAYGGVLAVGLFSVVGTVFDGTVVGRLGTPIALAIIPTCIAMAILRYRLYDIDRIVSRTVAYALLSGLLAGVYVTSVLVLSRLLALVSAGGDVTVAAATLTAAAVVVPARRRIQTAVDRRFDRARYDARQVAVGFRDLLRDEVDLDGVAAAVCDAVVRTVAPTGVSVWLRDTGLDR